MNHATRIMVSTFGALVGLAGMEHGIGEILQGNLPPAGLMILSWPGSAFFHALGGEPALTLLPNLLVTGILAFLFSLIFLVWAVWFIQQKNSSLILVLLSLLMLLAGGGIFPPILGILIAVAAARLQTPQTWWRQHLSDPTRRFLEKLWPWSFAACLLAWLAMFPGLAVLGYFFGVNNTWLILVLLCCMFGFLILSGVTGVARDLRD